MNKKQFRLLSKAMLIFFVFIIIAFSEFSIKPGRNIQKENIYPKN